MVRDVDGDVGSNNPLHGIILRARAAKMSRLHTPTCLRCRMRLTFPRGITNSGEQIAWSRGT